TAGKGSLGGTGTVTTDANGRAQFTDLTISGATGSHQLIFSADQLPSIKSTKFDVIKASTVTTITADNPEPSDPNQPVTVVFTVTSTGGTPTGRVDVTVSNGLATETCNATVAQGSCAITLITPGDRTLTASYRGDALFAVSEGSAPHQVTTSPPPPVNQAPVANDDPSYTTSRTGVPLEVSKEDGVLKNDTDPDGDPLSAVNAGIPQHGSVVLRTDGSFTYTPDGTDTGTDTFTYDASDGDLSSTATVTITISP
ncbi:MAG: Ig-like domain-containing protein, partial [Gemmatimonadales bacterium]